MRSNDRTASYYSRSSNNAFIGTDLEQQLRARGYDIVVIIGLTTPHCVSTTTRMAGDLGFSTFIVSDATAAHEAVGHDGRHYTAEEIHAVSLVTLKDEFATVAATETLLDAIP